MLTDTQIQLCAQMLQAHLERIEAVTSEFVADVARLQLQGADMDAFAKAALAYAIARESDTGTWTWLISTRGVTA